MAVETVMVSVAWEAVMAVAAVPMAVVTMTVAVTMSVVTMTVAVMAMRARLGLRCGEEAQSDDGDGGQQETFHLISPRFILWV